MALLGQLAEPPLCLASSDVPLSARSARPDRRRGLQLSKEDKNRPSIARQLTIDPEWLATRAEAVIDPELPIIDPHHHLWDVPGRRYLFDEFLVDVDSGHNIRATVFVQSHSMFRLDGPEELKPIGEIEFANGIAAQSASGMYGPARICAGIVGTVDFMLGDRVEAVLEAYLRAGGGRFRGVRMRTAWHEHEDFQLTHTPAGVLMNSTARAGIACLSRAGLTYDIWAYHTQLNEVIDVSRAFPNLQIVVDHIGGPLLIGPYAGKRAEVFAEWSGRIRELAASTNVSMKIGGMAMRYCGGDFHTRPRAPASEELAAAWRPYVETCIDAFGAHRCMFESNFPIDKAMCSYPILWNAFKRLTSDYSADNDHPMIGEEQHSLVAERVGQPLAMVEVEDEAVPLLVIGDPVIESERVLIGHFQPPAFHHRQRRRIRRMRMQHADGVGARGVDGIVDAVGGLVVLAGAVHWVALGVDQHQVRRRDLPPVAGRRADQHAAGVAPYRDGEMVPCALVEPVEDGEAMRRRQVDPGVPNRIAHGSSPGPGGRRLGGGIVRCNNDLVPVSR